MAEEPAAPARSSAPGVRLRIWIACLVTALLGAAGVLAVAGAFLPVGTEASPELVAALPWVAAGVPLLAGIAFAAWLARGLIDRIASSQRQLDELRAERARIEGADAEL